MVKNFMLLGTFCKVYVTTMIKKSNILIKLTQHKKESYYLGQVLSEFLDLFIYLRYNFYSRQISRNVLRYFDEFIPIKRD